MLDDQTHGVSLGASDYLVKPFTRQAVQQMLHRLAPTSYTGPTTAQTQASIQTTILLTENNEANIATIQDYLVAKGYHIVIARNGIEAVAQAREVQPALILMDIQMPGMDGIEATRHIRAEESLAHTLIIASRQHSRCPVIASAAWMPVPTTISASPSA